MPPRAGLASRADRPDIKRLQFSWAPVLLLRTQAGPTHIRLKRVFSLLMGKIEAADPDSPSPAVHSGVRVNPAHRAGWV